MEGNEKGRIEAILFVAGDAVEIRDLARALGQEEKDVRARALRLALLIRNAYTMIFDRLI